MAVGKVGVARYDLQPRLRTADSARSPLKAREFCDLGILKRYG